MAFVTGWKKDPRSTKDFIYKPKIVALPDHVDFIALLPAVADQNGNGACTGFTFAALLGFWAKKLGIVLMPQDMEWFSQWWIYNGARYIEGTLPFDEGAYPRDCLDWLMEKGGLPYHFWPYTEKFDKTSPPTKFDPEAAKFPLAAYYRVTGSFDGVCNAMASGHCVALGTPWFDKWMDPGSSGKLAVITEDDEVVGGHAYLAVGYDRIAGHLICLNSWGKEWGENGFCYLPAQAFPVFNRVGGYDAYYIEVAWGPQPKPDQPCMMTKAFLAASNKAAKILGSKRRFHSTKEGKV